MVKTSRRPGNKAAGQGEAIAAKTCPFKHGQSHAQLALMFKPVRYRATDNLPPLFVPGGRSFVPPARWSHQQTFSWSVSMSQACHMRTHAPQQRRRYSITSSALAGW
jgi:hypothetical protein